MAKDDMFPLQKDHVTKSRIHTDLGCNFCFVAVVAGIAGLTVFGLAEGDTKRLTHGRDYHGRLCGEDEGVEKKPYMYYCGASEWVDNYPKTLNYKSRTCVSECSTGTADQIPCMMPEYVNTSMLPGVTEHNITFLSTINVEVTQSVALQRSYPSQAYLGRYCVPVWSSNNTLYAEVINGPLKEVSQFNAAVGSFVHAWPVILGAAVLAAVLGIVYLYVLKYYAGLLLYISLWLGVVLVALASLFFLFGIFPDPMDDLGWYQQLSPIFVVFYGAEARFMSALVGLVGLAVTACMFFQALNENIDESIGIICAAVDCMLGSGSGFSFLIQPVLQSVVVTVLACALMVGFMLLSSVTTINRELMAMNGEYVPHETYAQVLEAVEEREWYVSLGMKFYVFGALWVMLTAMAFCHFVIAYAVVDWFFVPSIKVKNKAADALSEPFKKAAANQGKRVDGVRVKGVDKAKGSRAGYIEKGPHGKVLVVPLGEKGPDGRDFVRVDQEVTEKSLPLLAFIDGIAAGGWYHLGTLAIAGVVNVVTFPLRGLSEMLKSFMGFSSGGGLRANYEEEDQTPGGLAIAGLGLVTTFLDELFGRYSKSLYVDIVLRSTNFNEASNDAYDFIADAGGAVALLHGGTGTYEMIGVILITSVCSLATMIVLTKVSVFADEEAAHYVSDPSIMVLLAGVLSCVIASSFMALFSMTADSLLYVFAWSRKEYPGKVKEFCPTPLLHVMGREMEEEPALALQPNPRSKLTRFSHAASKYKDTVMATMQARGATGAEQRPLLGLSGGLTTFR